MFNVVFIGKLNNWWSEETLKKFKERTKCVIEQYSNFKPEQVDLNLNGVNGQGENIADIVGFKLGYKAYGKNYSLSAIRSYIN